MYDVEIKTEDNRRETERGNEKNGIKFHKWLPKGFKTFAENILLFVYL